MRNKINSLFSAQTEKVYDIQKAPNGSILYGKYKIRPDVWVYEGGEAKRLVDLLGLEADQSGDFYLPIRGVLTDKEIIWETTKYVDELNANYGIARARFNSITWSRFSNAFKRSHSKIVSSKMKLEILSAMNEINRLMQTRELSEQFELRVRTGQLINLVDPFLPIDPKIMEEGFGKLGQSKVYSSIQNQTGPSKAFVGNTFLSYWKIQDVDSDTLSIAEFELIERVSRKQVSTWRFDKKWPHTTRQLGSHPVTNQQDFEGDIYSPWKKYRRMVAPWGKGSSTEFKGLDMMLSQSRSLAEDLSVKNYLNPRKLSDMISKTIKEDIIGLLTTKQWLKESLDVTNILRAIPEYLAEHYHLESNDGRLKMVQEWLSKPENRKLLQYKLNTGFDDRRALFEGTLKIKNTSDIEVLSMNTYLSIRDRILEKGSTESYGLDEGIIFSNEFLQASSYDRLKMIIGLKTPTFVRGKELPKIKKKSYVEIRPDTQITLSDGSTRRPLVKALMDTKLYDNITGHSDSLLQVQEVDLHNLLPEEYLKQLSPEMRSKMSKGLIVSMKGLDNFSRKPLIGKHPKIGEFNEKAWVVLPAIDLSTGKILDPLSNLTSHVETTLQKELSPWSRISRFGFGELSGPYKVENLTRSSKYTRLIAKTNGLSEDYIIRLAKHANKTGNQDSIKLLRGFKARVDALESGDVGTTALSDITRVLQKTMGSIGRDADFVRSALSGNLSFKNKHVAERVAEAFIFRSTREVLDPTEAADRIAKLFPTFPFIGAVRSNGDGTYVGMRAVAGNTVTPVFGSRKDIYSAKRPIKSIGYSQNSLPAGDFNIAIVNTAYDKGKVSKINHLFGDPDDFQAEDFSVGLAYETEAGRRKIDEAIYRNLEPGTWSNTRQGEFVNPLKIRDPITKEFTTIYTSVDRQRLLFSPLGTLRIEPHTGVDAAYSVQNGIRQDIDLIISLDELLSKSGGGHMQDIVARLGEDAERAYHHFLTSSEPEKAKKAFIKEWGDKLGSQVVINFNNNQEQLNLTGVPVFSTQVNVRNTDADQMIHNFTGWGSWNSRTKSFLDETSRKAVEWHMKGKTLQDTLVELSEGSYRWLRENKAIDESISNSDFMSILLQGHTHHMIPDTKLRGSSIEGQIQYSKREDEIAQIAKRLYLERSESISRNYNEQILMDEATQFLSLETNKRNSVLDQAFKSGLQAAIGENLIDQLDSVIKHIF